MEPIRNYGDFCARLRLAGFSLAGESGEGIFALGEHFAQNIQWHTGDRDTDPWAFRMRVLTEESGIGYGKYFLCKGGYMTREWASCFLVLKRGGQTYEDTYQSGRMSYLERAVCRYVSEKGEAAFHQIKAQVGAKGLEAALNQLQTGMFLTISGETFRLSKDNAPYGWPVTTFQMAEDFWGPEVANKALSVTPEEARELITRQILKLNPAAERKAIERFLR